MSSIRVCAISDIECSRGCGSGACKKESAQPDERGAFEAHMFSTGMVWDNSREDDGDGDEQYADVETRVNWGVWQAARAGLIEQHHRDSAELRRLCAARDEARRTAEYWKAEHNAGNKRIAELDAARKGDKS